MLGDERRLVAVDQRLETLEMRPVERLRSADRHAHAVERDGIVPADAGQRVVRRAAGAHVVFGVDLEEAALLAPPPGSRGRCSCLRLVPARPATGCAGKREAPGGRGCWVSSQSVHRGLRFPADCVDYEGTSRVSASGEPLRPPGRSMVAQVPPSTNFQALPW